VIGPTPEIVTSRRIVPSRPKAVKRLICVTGLRAGGSRDYGGLLYNPPGG
jgi:hypothetical protein